MASKTPPKAIPIQIPNRRAKLDRAIRTHEALLRRNPRSADLATRLKVLRDTRAALVKREQDLAFVWGIVDRLLGPG